MAPRRLLLAVAGSAALALAGCSGRPAPPDTTTPVAPAASAAPSGPASAGGSPSPFPSVTSTSPANCLPGNWRLARFLGTDGKQTYGTGEGGDVTATFRDGTYELKGAGQDPIRLTLAGRRGELAVDGVVTGRYQADDQQVVFSKAKSTGTARLVVNGDSTKLSMDQAAQIIGPQGSALVGCAPDRMEIVMDAVRLEFEPR